MIETAFDRAMAAVDELAAEDLRLLLQTVIARRPAAGVPALFCQQADADGLFLHLWLTADRAGLLWALLERAVDGYIEPGTVRRMADWLSAGVENLGP